MGFDYCILARFVTFTANENNNAYCILVLGKEPRLEPTGPKEKPGSGTNSGPSRYARVVKGSD